MIVSVINFIPIFIYSYIGTTGSWFRLPRTLCFQFDTACGGGFSAQRAKHRTLARGVRSSRAVGLEPASAPLVGSYDNAERQRHSYWLPPTPDGSSASRGRARYECLCGGARNLASSAPRGTLRIERVGAYARCRPKNCARASPTRCCERSETPADSKSRSIAEESGLIFLKWIFD